MIQRFSTQFPDWMRPTHPVVSYVLGKPGRVSTTGRYLRALVVVIFLLVFVTIGYVIASDVFRENPLEQPLSQMLSEVLFWPAFILQLIVQLLTLFMTINTVGEEKRRQTWDSLNTTTAGVGLFMRARWSATIFYRVRGLVGILLIVRLILIGGILFDLTAFRGEYLNYLTGTITPQVPLIAGIVLLAFVMTSSLLLPFTALGFDAAVGLLISTFVQQRTYVVLSQITLAALRIVVVFGLLFLVLQFRDGTLAGTDLGLWMLLFAFGAVGDWGLSFLYLGFLGAEVWAEVPYGIFIGLALLLFVVVQAALTDLILAWAIRRADKAGRR